MSRGGIIVAVLALAAATWAVLRLAAAGHEDLGPAADVAIKAGDRTVSLSDFKGKVVLIDFWATWCGPCRQSMPEIGRIYEKYHSRGLEVMGVAMDDDGREAAVQSFAKDMGITYPVGMPTSHESVLRYKMDSIPLLVIVDRSGNIQGKQAGYAPGMERGWAYLVERLLAE